MKPAIIIPARLAATRLPNKPLADIGGAPMIVHVLRRAEEAAIGPVIVAAGEPEIADAVRAAGGTAVLTDPSHPSGSDRVHEAAASVAECDVVVNLQGDLPLIDPLVIRRVLEPLSEPAVEIATLAMATDDPEERDNPNVVKAIPALRGDSGIGRALYFTRAPAPTGPGPVYHHIGIYAFRRAALDRFVALAPSPLEQREKLEQLRALEAGMRIDLALVDTLPFGVDTPADLERARSLMAARAGAANS